MTDSNKIALTKEGKNSLVILLIINNMHSRMMV